MARIYRHTLPCHFFEYLESMLLCLLLAALIYSGEGDRHSSINHHRRICRLFGYAIHRHCRWLLCLHPLRLHLLSPLRLPRRFMAYRRHPLARVLFAWLVPAPAASLVRACAHAQHYFATRSC